MLGERGERRGEGRGEQGRGGKSKHFVERAQGRGTAYAMLHGRNQGLNTHSLPSLWLLWKPPGRSLPEVAGEEAAWVCL